MFEPKFTIIAPFRLDSGGRERGTLTVHDDRFPILLPVGLSTASAASRFRTRGHRGLLGDGGDPFPAGCLPGGRGNADERALSFRLGSAYLPGSADLRVGWDDLSSGGARHFRRFSLPRAASDLFPDPSAGFRGLPGVCISLGVK